MNVELNGEVTPVANGATVATIAARLGVAHRRGVAVAVNGEVVTRRDWDTTVLMVGDRVEVVTAVQGGA